MLLKLLIDADPLVYRSGFAAQETVYDEYIGDAVVAQPVENAIHIVKTSVDAMVDAVEIHTSQRADKQLVLSGPGNYRFGIATVRPYKGNRTTVLPVHYQAIRDYLTGKQGAKVIKGREADDEISIRAWRAKRDNLPYVVATIDKDLDQIPGLHYDYMKHVFYEVGEQDAQIALWAQILSGDPADDVPGAWKIGKAKAMALVQRMYSEELSDAEKWSTVVNLYRVSQNLEGCPYKDRDAEAVALETARLVYVQQNPGELWNPPGIPLGLIGGDIDD